MSWCDASMALRADSTAFVADREKHQLVLVQLLFP